MVASTALLLAAAAAVAADRTSVSMLAALCHEAVRTYGALLGTGHLPDWECSPDELRDATVEVVQLALQAPHENPREQHARWLAALRRRGWRYGRTRDAAAKTHPYCLDYDLLPSEKRFRGGIFYGLISGYVNAAQTGTPWMKEANMAFGNQPSERADGGYWPG
jgi:hypothetical protein